MRRRRELLKGLSRGELSEQRSEASRSEPKRVREEGARTDEPERECATNVSSFILDDDGGGDAALLSLELLLLVNDAARCCDPSLAYEEEVVVDGAAAAAACGGGAGVAVEVEVEVEGKASGEDDAILFLSEYEKASYEAELAGYARGG